MSEVLAFLMGYLVSWPSLAVLFLIGVILEHKRAHGWAVFIGLVTMVASYFYFDISIKVILEGAIGYLLLGFAWSFWRYHCHMGEAVKEIRESQPSDFYLQSAVSNLAPSKNLDLITFWIIIWPFSFVENILGDFITFIQTLVTKVFHQVYTRIYTAHVSSLKDLTK